MKKIKLSKKMNWEIFLDTSYYDMWAVRPVGDQSFTSQNLFHVTSKEEAERMKEVLEGFNISNQEGKK